MSIEEYIPDIDSGETGGQTSEQIKEVSEKFKESIKKGTAGVKRTKKDEGKAKKHDLLLANFLVKIIINKKYDDLSNSLFKALNSGYPSNFILGILSLINIKISDKIREVSGKEKIIFDYISEEKIDFDDNNLNINIKNRINYWVEDIIDIVTIEYSSILTKNLIKILKQDDNLKIFTAKVFRFFLNNININISEEKSLGISEFILSEVENQIKKLKINQI